MDLAGIVLVRLSCCYYRLAHHGLVAMARSFHLALLVTFRTYRLEVYIPYLDISRPQK